MKDVKSEARNLGTFKIDYKSEIDQQHYVGAFTVKRMSIADLASLGVRKAQLNGAMHYDPRKPGQGVDADTDELNGVLAHLDICLIKTPDWWNLSNVADVGLLYTVYEEVMRFENTFRGRTMGGRSDTEREEASEAEGGESDESADVRKVVASEVQASLEP